MKKTNKHSNPAFSALFGSLRSTTVALTTGSALLAGAALSNAIAQEVTPSLPQGGQVVAGQLQNGDLVNPAPGAKTLTVTGTSSTNGFVAIDWKSFNVAQGHTVNYEQLKTALNYVSGPTASQVEGTVNAKDVNFILVNPNGIHVKGGASLNVGTLSLSTRSLTKAQLEGANADFNLDKLGNGEYAAPVKVEGTLQAKSLKVEGSKVILSHDSIGSLTHAPDTDVLDVQGEVSVSVPTPEALFVTKAVKNTVKNQAGLAKDYRKATTATITGLKVNGTTKSVKTFAPVNTAADVANLHANPDLNFLLENDVDLANVNLAGQFASKAFKGTFEGDNHTLKNLTIKADETGKDKGPVGLFAKVAATGTVKNLNLESAQVSAVENDQVGTVVGSLQGTVENVHVVGSVEGRNAVGGLVGHASSGSKVKFASFKGKRAKAADLPTDYDVKGTDNVGGLVGKLEGTSGEKAKGGVENSFVIASVQATNENAGGIVGSTESANLNGVFFTGTPVVVSDDAKEKVYAAAVSAKQNAGGLVGQAESSVVKSGFAHAYASADKNVGGLVGKLVGGSLESSVAFNSVFASKNNEFAGAAAGAANAGAVIAHVYADAENDFTETQLKDLVGEGSTAKDPRATDTEAGYVAVSTLVGFNNDANGLPTADKQLFNQRDNRGKVQEEVGLSQVSLEGWQQYEGHHPLPQLFAPTTVVKFNPQTTTYAGVALSEAVSAVYTPKSAGKNSVAAVDPKRLSDAVNGETVVRNAGTYNEFGFTSAYNDNLVEFNQFFVSQHPWLAAHSVTAKKLNLKQVSNIDYGTSKSEAFEYAFTLEGLVGQDKNQVAPKDLLDFSEVATKAMTQAWLDKNGHTNNVDTYKATVKDVTLNDPSGNYTLGEDFEVKISPRVLNVSTKFLGKDAEDVLYGNSLDSEAYAKALTVNFEGNVYQETNLGTLSTDAFKEFATGDKKEYRTQKVLRTDKGLAHYLVDFALTSKNYILGNVHNAKVTVLPRAVTVRTELTSNANPNQKNTVVFGDSSADYTASLQAEGQGFVYGDSVETLQKEGVFNKHVFAQPYSNDVETAAAGTKEELTFTTNNSPEAANLLNNYDVTYAPATVKVDKRKVGVSLAAEEVVYGEEDAPQAKFVFSNTNNAVTDEKLAKLVKVENNGYVNGRTADAGRYKRSVSLDETATNNFELDVKNVGDYVVKQREIEVALSLQSKDDKTVQANQVVFGDNVKNTYKPTLYLTGSTGLAKGDSLDDLQVTYSSSVLTQNEKIKSVYTADAGTKGELKFELPESEQADGKTLESNVKFLKNYKVKKSYNDLLVVPREVGIHALSHKVVYGDAQAPSNLLFTNTSFGLDKDVLSDLVQVDNQAFTKDGKTKSVGFYEQNVTFKPEFAGNFVLAKTSKFEQVEVLPRLVTLSAKLEKVQKPGTQQAETNHVVFGDKLEDYKATVYVSEGNLVYGDSLDALQDEIGFGSTVFDGNNEIRTVQTALAGTKHALDFQIPTPYLLSGRPQLQKVFRNYTFSKKLSDVYVDKREVKVSLAGETLVYGDESKGLKLDFTNTTKELNAEVLGSLVKVNNSALTDDGRTKDVGVYSATVTPETADVKALASNFKFETPAEAAKVEVLKRHVTLQAKLLGAKGKQDNTVTYGDQEDAYKRYYKLEVANGSSSLAYDDKVIAFEGSFKNTAFIDSPAHTVDAGDKAELSFTNKENATSKNYDVEVKSANVAVEKRGLRVKLAGFSTPAGQPTKQVAVEVENAPEGLNDAVAKDFVEVKHDGYYNKDGETYTSNVGEYPVTASLTPEAAKNYTIAYVNAPKVVITEEVRENKPEVVNPGSSVTAPVVDGKKETPVVKVEKVPSTNTTEGSKPKASSSTVDPKAPETATSTEGSESKPKDEESGAKNVPDTASIPKPFLTDKENTGESTVVVKKPVADNNNVRGVEGEVEDTPKTVTTDNGSPVPAVPAAVSGGESVVETSTADNAVAVKLAGLPNAVVSSNVQVVGLDADATTTASVAEHACGVVANVREDQRVTEPAATPARRGSTVRFSSFGGAKKTETKAQTKPAATTKVTKLEPQKGTRIPGTRQGCGNNFQFERNGLSF